MRAFSLLFCCLLFAGAAMAGNTGGIAGKVTTGVNRPVSGAAILVYNTTGIQMKALTNASGAYRLVRLPAGAYEVRISKAGFESQRYIEVRCQSGARQLRLDAVLRKSGKWGGAEWVKVYQPVYNNRSSVTYKWSTGKRVMVAGKSSRTHGEVAMVSGHHPVAAYSSAGSAEAAPVMMAAPPAPASGDMRAYRSSGYEKRAYTLTADDASDPGIRNIAEENKKAPAGVAPRAGLLTSGEVNDFSKWTLWQDIDETELSAYRSTWSLYPENRFTVLLKSADGKPLCNARVIMSRTGDKASLWEAVTDNTGKAELWSNMFTQGSAPASLMATVRYASQTYNVKNLKPFHDGANIIDTRQSCSVPGKLDIAFIVDATGSMGDEINYLKEELKDILGKVKDSLPSLQVQTGCIFYRDREDEYLARVSDLKSDFNQTLDFIRDNGADGGGDTPEAVEVALQEALDNLHWREDAVARIAFLILDAPPHDDSATVRHMKELTYQYAKRGIRLVPVICSGADKSTEYLMRSLALATNGTYLFLTDHSGVGGSHISPTTDKFDVEYLNGLIYRVIYQFSYMPPCNRNSQTLASDTTTIRQEIPTDSVRNDTVQTVQLQWRYYPNPTSGTLHIEHQNTQGDLYICDIGGKVLLRYTAALAGTTTVEVGNYPSGVYFIRYQYGPDKWVDGKFVVVH